jgi:hypothetical protein
VLHQCSAAVVAIIFIHFRSRWRFASNYNHNTFQAGGGTRLTRLARVQLNLHCAELQFERSRVAIILLFLQPPMILTNHLHFSRAVDRRMMDLLGQYCALNRVLMTHVLDFRGFAHPRHTHTHTHN